MPLNIEVSRPFSLLVVVGLTFAGLSTMMEAQTSEADVLEARGGEQAPQLAIRTAEDEMRRARLEQQLAEQHIEVLKYQLKRLEDERNIMGEDLSDEQNEQFRAGLRMLVELIEGKRRADDKMVQSFKEMWEADRAGLAAAALSADHPEISIRWPIEPIYGISAIFHDPEYSKFFGMEHNAIDIPALQGTVITAPADGVVESIVDNGMGYSYLTLSHDGKYRTQYGHVSAFLVQEGQHVLQGDPIAESGGMPGTKGAGNLTTGPHLHFELITGEGHINPLKYLPAAGVQLRR